MRQGFGSKMIALFAAALVFAPSALGATPEEIYADLRDNGRLDKAYTQAELSAYLQSAAVQGYGNPIVTTPPAVPPTGGEGADEGIAGAETDFAGVGGLDDTASAGTLPFTGAEMTLFAIVGAVLILGGMLLRASARQR